MDVKNVNIYFVPNDKNKIGGKFYNVYINSDEKLDLSPFLSSDIDTLEAKVKEQDESFKKAGGIILKRDEEIGSTTVYTPNNGEVELDREQQDAYQRWLQLEEKSDNIYEQRKREMTEFLKRQYELDLELQNIQEEKQRLTDQVSKSFRKEKKK